MTDLTFFHKAIALVYKEEKNIVRIKLGTGRLYIIREGLGDKRENIIREYTEEQGLKLIWHEDEFALEGTKEQLYAMLYRMSERWTILIV